MLTIVEHVQQRLASHQPQPSLCSITYDSWSAKVRLAPTVPIFDPARAGATENASGDAAAAYRSATADLATAISPFLPLPLDFLGQVPIYQPLHPRLIGQCCLAVSTATAQKAMDRLLAV